MNRLNTRKTIMAGCEFPNYKDSQPKSVILKVINMVSDYMDLHFPGFVWEFEDISPGRFDYDNKHNMVGIRVFTNACDKEFSVISFAYDVDENVFKETPDWDLLRDIDNNLLTSNSYHTRKNTKFKKCYLALYNEADRPDGNPQIFEIPSLIDYNGNNTSFETIFSQFTYVGNGCMEIRTVDFDDEEDVWVFKDNLGYRFLGDTE